MTAVTQQPKRQETYSTLKEIFDTMEVMDNSLIMAKINKARCTAVLAGAVTFLWFLGAIRIIDLLMNAIPFTFALSFTVAGWVLPFVLGLTVYVLSKKSYTKEFVSWKKTLGELRESVEQNKA